MLDTTPTLQGEFVTLRPMDAARDADALFAITPPDTFRYFLSWPAAWDAASFREFLVKHAATPKARMFTVLDAGGRVVGASAYLDIDSANRCVEIGATWYDPAVRGTRVNPECKLLQLAHAFDTLGCVRVTLKCDARNLHSQRAIAKLGATRESTLRRHRIQPDGFVRDTVYFSILPEEWPAVREGLRHRLAAGPVH